MRGRRLLHPVTAGPATVNLTVAMELVERPMCVAHRLHRRVPTRVGG